MRFLRIAIVVSSAAATGAGIDRCVVLGGMGGKSEIFDMSGWHERVPPLRWFSSNPVTRTNEKEVSIFCAFL